MNERAIQLTGGDVRWSPDEIKKQRVVYLVLFFFMLAGHMAGFGSGLPPLSSRTLFS